MKLQNFATDNQSYSQNYTVRKAKRDAGPQHKVDGKFRHPYR
jgi:hypothetical protein